MVDASAPGGFDFLGYHCERGLKWPRDQSLKELKERVREKTSRLEGRRLSQIGTDVNRSLRGWHGYFQHSQANLFTAVDGYVRRQLRSLRKSGEAIPDKDWVRRIGAGPMNGLYQFPMITGGCADGRLLSPSLSSIRWRRGCPEGGRGGALEGSYRLSSGVGITNLNTGLGSPVNRQARMPDPHLRGSGFQPDGSGGIPAARSSPLDREH